jgi:hypothetical protein
MRSTQKKTKSAKPAKKKPAIKDLQAKDPAKVKGGLLRLR